MLAQDEREFLITKNTLVIIVRMINMIKVKLRCGIPGWQNCQKAIIDPCNKWAPV